MNFTANSLVAVVISLTAVASARAEEKRIPKSEVPKAVLDAVAAKYPTMKIAGYEQDKDENKTVYEINGKQGTQALDVSVSPEGKILSEERTITIAEVPTAVKKGLSDSKFAKAKVEKIEKVTEGNEAPKYEIVVKEGKERQELVFTEGGELAKQESKKDKD